VVTMFQDMFPAFFTRNSGFGTHVESHSVADVAKIIKSNIDLKVESGILVAVPVPKQFESSDNVEKMTRKAIDEAKEKKITGKNVTPFLLSRIAELTGKGEVLGAQTFFFFPPLLRSCRVSCVKHCSD
jgi:pseudouridine-5'-phosphate glycosidase